MVILCLSIILFLFGEIIVGQKTWALNSGGGYVLFALIGTIICIGIGELLIWWSSRQNKKQKLAKGE